MREVIRRVYFAPYRKRMGPRFALSVWDTGRTINGGKYWLGYQLRLLPPGKRCRECGEDWPCSDSQRTDIRPDIRALHCVKLPVTLFEGEDFGCSPLHSIDSYEAVESIMGFLTLRPGDTDADYFAEYTSEQLRFCDDHAEALRCEVEARFGEGVGR